MKDTVRLGRILGVPVGLNWSLLAIVGIFAFGLAENRLPYDAPAYSGAAYATAGALTAIALLVAVLLHELGHAIVARRLGLGVEGITLSWMGGVTRIIGDADSPGREFAVAAIGPLVSLGLGAALWGCREAAAATGAGHLLVSALGWLAVINVVLALFNLIPAAPLDGGRVLHAIVWGLGHDRWTATKVASKAGIVLAGAVLGLGLYEVLGQGDELNGVLVVVLGWWLLGAARDEEQLAAVHHVLGGVHVHDVMRPVGSAPGWVTTEEFLTGYAGPHPGWVWLLERWGGGYSGVLAGDALHDSNSPRWSGIRPVDVAVPVADAAPASPREEVLAALQRTGGRRVLLVVEGGRTVGAILPADIEALIRTRRRPLLAG